MVVSGVIVITRSLLSTTAEPRTLSAMDWVAIMVYFQCGRRGQNGDLPQERIEFAGRLGKEQAGYASGLVIE